MEEKESSFRTFTRTLNWGTRAFLGFIRCAYMDDAKLSRMDDRPGRRRTKWTRFTRIFIAYNRRNNVLNADLIFLFLFFFDNDGRENLG